MATIHLKTLRCLLAAVALLLAGSACETQGNRGGKNSAPSAASKARSAAKPRIPMPGIHAGDEGP